jgi:lipoprotein-releasing system permease protein
MSYEWFISLRYLKAKRKQAFISLITIISVLGVAIGVSALIVVLAVMTGAQEDIKEKIVGANSHILVTGMSVSLGENDVKKVVDMAMSTKDVKSASPYIFNQVIVTSVEKVAGMALRGIDVSKPEMTTDITKFMEEGKLIFLQDRYSQTTVEPDDFGTQVKVKRSGIILGRELAFNIRVRVGDPVTVVSAMGRMTPTGMVPISREFYVVGLFHTGMYEYDSALALVSIVQAQSLFKMKNKVTGIEIRVEDIYSAPQIAASITEKLGF